MNALTNKTSSQAFFLRVLKVIIQLRDAALHAMKKSKLASEAVAKKAKEAEAAAAAATASAAAATSPTTESSMEVSEAAGTEAAPEASPSPDGATSAEASAVVKEPSLPSLSDELLLNTLWETLSACLRDLADTPDHHAVLVLQATVEAFFLVHAAPTQPEDKKKVQQKETRQEQLAHIQEQNTIIGTSENPSEPATNAAAGGGAAASGQSNAATNAVAVSNAAAEAGETGKAEAELSVETQKFLAFAETHRTVLNQILRQSTVHLADGPFSVLVDHTRVLDFDIKRR